jgi:hypothetical protein
VEIDVPGQGRVLVFDRLNQQVGQRPS